MATKAKENVGKEKRVTSSSNSHATTTKSSSSSKPCNPKPSSTTTSSTEKPVPNYLKPTISSRPEEAFKPLKKHGGAHDHNNDANQKQAMLNRRRSFDKPPSASRVQSALISPGPKERKLTARSSSFSSKTTTSSFSSSSKVAASLDRPLKSPKPALKAQPSHSRTSTSKPTTVATSKREASASNRIPPKSPDHQTRTLVNNVEAKQEATEPLEVHEQDVNEVVAEVESCSTEVNKVPPEEPKVAVEDNNGHSDDAVDNGDDENEKGCTEVSEEEVKANHIPTDVGLEESVEEKAADDDQNAQLKEEDIDQNNNVNGESHTEDEAKEDQVAEEEGKENEAVVVDETAEEENEKEVIKTVDVEKEDEVVCEGGSDMLEGHDNVEEAKLAEAAEAEASVKRAVQGGQAVAAGKKDAPAAYNDVIEETASKLLEKRKNKVKALVGAFETVIDYESK